MENEYYGEKDRRSGMVDRRICTAHSGIEKDIERILGDVNDIKKFAREICKKQDAIKTYIMTLLGSVAVSVILLLMGKLT